MGPQGSTTAVTKDHGGIDQSAHQDRAHHQGLGGLVGEAVLLSGLRDAVEADEAVGGVAGHGDDTGQAALADHLAVGNLGEEGLHVGEVRLCQQNADHAEEHGAHQQHGHGGLEPAGGLDALTFM